ncbi:hypothetical protein [Streptomyces phaeochromogenes]
MRFPTGGESSAAGPDTRAGLLRHGAHLVVRDLGELIEAGAPT